MDFQEEYSAGDVRGRRVWGSDWRFFHFVWRSRMERGKRDMHYNKGRLSLAERTV